MSKIGSGGVKTSKKT